MSTTTRIRRWRLPIAGVAALALLATGCGGDDEGIGTDEGLGTDEGIVEEEPLDEETVEEEPLEETEAETTEEEATEEEATEEEATEEETEPAFDEAAAEEFTTDLLPLNDSGASGTVTVLVMENTVRVVLEAFDVSDKQPHAQHIHIGNNNECPTQDADEDGDGLISTPEGKPAYGPIKVSLTTQGPVGEQSAVAVDRFPVADPDGSYIYERTFDLPEGTTADAIPQGVVVVHGFADSPLGDDPDAYDGPPSPLSDAVPQEATLPVLCGALAGPGA